jgi:hypothetical protein
MRRFAASILDSFSHGCPQQLFDHANGQVFFTWLRCCRRSFFSLLKINAENARCRGVFSPWTRDFGMVPRILFSSSTRTTSSIGGVMVLIHKEINDDSESYQGYSCNGPEYPMMSFFTWCFVFCHVGSCVIEDIIRDECPHQEW